MSTDSVWKVLSAIDCSEHVEKKDKFSYLAWTWAWAMVKERYPYANYTLLDDTVYPDGSMEVRVEVNISQQVAVDSGNHKLIFNTLSHTMWLPVLDFRNKAIKNPDAFAVNSSRMRCLVKCLAMFGLGHYIYAGESLPTPKSVEDWNNELADSIIAIKDGMAEGKLEAAYEAWNELSDEEKQGIWVAPSKGGAFTTAERAVFKSNEWNAAKNNYHGEVK
jgi:hypothetical protein